MKRIYDSTIFCCFCYKVTKQNSGDRFRAFTTIKNEDGSRRMFFKSPRFVCSDCYNKLWGSK